MAPNNQRGHNQPVGIVAADAPSIASAAEVLRGSGLVAVPTETVYGLAARADCPQAVAAIYRAKGRPDFNPLIVHVANLEAAGKLAEFGPAARRLAAAFWPGPLTLVLPRKADAPLAPAVTAGLETVALRCPAHPVMQAVLTATGLPLAAPSANRSGEVSPTSAEHVAASLGSAALLILDAGQCPRGIESTIVALRSDDRWEVLRPGPITEAQISEFLGGAPAVTTSGGEVEAPGQLASHYSPGKPLRMEAREASDDEFHIGFGAIGGSCNLSPAADLGEAAANLYAALHRAAASLMPRIAVAPVPDTGVGAAINDRLRRAAA